LEILESWFRCVSFISNGRDSGQSLLIVVGDSLVLVQELLVYFEMAVSGAKSLLIAVGKILWSWFRYHFYSFKCP
jgi:hypothetical protein